MTSDSCQIVELPGTRSSVRERILEAAIQLFAANGYENTSTMSIARLAGTSETQLMKNFINKQGLLEAVFAEVLEKMLQLLGDVRHLLSPRDKLHEFFRGALRWFDENPSLGKMLLLDMRRIRAKNGGEVLSAPGAMVFFSQLDEIIEQARMAGQLKCTIRPSMIRSILFGAVGEVLRDSLVAQEAPSGSVTPLEIETTLDFLLSCFFVTDYSMD